MKEKLTLTIDKETKERAKRFARRKGVSLSQIVETYLGKLSGTEEDPLYELGKHPTTVGVSDTSEKHDHYIYKASDSDK